MKPALILSALFAFSSGAYSDQDPPEEPPVFRVITYNVLVGFNAINGPSRLKRWSDWLASKKPDVVALQELNLWTEQRLKTQALEWGHSHALVRGSLGLTSKYPITNVKYVTKGIHNGVLRGKTNGIYFFVAHLTTTGGHVCSTNFEAGVNQKLIQAGIILREIGEIRKEDTKLILAGDFNSYSPSDARGTLITAVIQSILNGSLVDTVGLFRKHGDRVQFTNGTLLGQPEGTTRDQIHGGRVDFIFASPPLAEFITAAMVAYDEETDTISDHYPVLADFQPAEVNTRTAAALRHDALRAASD